MCHNPQYYNMPPWKSQYSYRYYAIFSNLLFFYSLVQKFSSDCRFLALSILFFLNDESFAPIENNVQNYRFNSNIYFLDSTHWERIFWNNQSNYIYPLLYDKSRHKYGEFSCNNSSPLLTTCVSLLAHFTITFIFKKSFSWSTVQ